MTADRQGRRRRETPIVRQPPAAQSAVTEFASCQNAEGSNAVRQAATGGVSSMLPPSMTSATFTGQILAPTLEGQEAQERFKEFYEEELTRLEAGVEQERQTGQTTALAWRSEGQRRHDEALRREDPLHGATEGVKTFRAAKERERRAAVPRRLQEGVRNYLPIVVMCVCVLLAGVCSVLALHLDWSLRR